MKGYYINLECRRDRRRHIENNILTLDFFKDLERFEGIKIQEQCPELYSVGCSESWVKIIEKCIEIEDQDYFLLIEDDISIDNDDIFNNFLQDFEEIKEKEWDVITLTPHWGNGNDITLDNTFPKFYDNFYKIRQSFTMTGLIIKKSFLPIFLKNQKDGLKLLKETKCDGLYKNDIYWLSLQEEHTFLCYQEDFCSQLDITVNNSLKNNIYERCQKWNTHGRTVRNKLENLLLRYINNPYSDYNCFYLAREYEIETQYAIAMSYYLKCADNTKYDELAYESLIRIGYCLGGMDGRDEKSVSAYEHAISILPDRPEAYYILSLHYGWRKNFKKGYMYSQLAIHNSDIKDHPLYFETQYKGINYSLFQKAHTGFKMGKIIESNEIYEYLLNKDIDNDLRNIINGNVEFLKELSNFPEINKKKIDLNSKKIDIVLQGKYNDNVLQIADYYLELDFVNNIIISCWEDDIIQHINNDKIIIIKNKIPSNPGTGRRNLQIVSSLEGIKASKTEFVVKIRNDQRYTHESMINMYKFYEEYKERKLRFYYDKQKPRNRICVSGNFSEFSFHPRDHLFWGNREDLIDLFSLPLEKESITDKIKILDPRDQHLYYEYFVRSETYIGAHYLSNFDRNINYYLLDPKKYLFDNSDKYNETRDLSDKLTSQVFKSFPRKGIDLEWYKHKWDTYPYENQRAYYGERWHEDGL